MPWVGGGYPPGGVEGLDSSARGQGRVGLAVGPTASVPVQGRSKFRNVCRIFVVSNANKKKKNDVFLKDALQGGGGTHRSWPGGKGLDARDRNQVRTVVSEPSLDASTKCPSLHPCTCTRPQPSDNRGE